MESKQSNPTRIAAYLPPICHRFVKAYKEYSGKSESEIISLAVKKMYDDIPAKERAVILNTK